MESFLNLLWLAIALAALLTTPRRSIHVSVALGCALTLLFPIISLSDDLSADRDSREEALAVAVKAVILVIALVAIAGVEPTRAGCAALLLIPTANPRSPPRG